MDRYIEFILNHYMLSLALAVVTYLLIQEFFDTAFKKFASISPLMAVTKMNTSEPLVVDVREAPDFVQSHIEEAVNIPLGKITESLSTIESHKKGPVLLVCQNGISSAAAAKKLTKAGFEQVFVITGGMQAWEGDYRLPVKLANKRK